MSTLMKTATAALGGRGGGTKDMAQGGAPESNRLEEVIAQAAAQLRS
jgi:alanyl-tRNA synthetase